MAALDVIPLMKFPASWPVPVVASVAMAVLAGLDLLGAIAAKEWAEKQSIAAIAFGTIASVALFWFYASSLQYAELAVVTMGWIVLLQVGIIIVDRVHFGTVLGPDKIGALIIILVAQGYLVLAPNSS